MNRIHGTILDPQGQTRFDHLDVSIASHDLPAGRGGWVGYFDPPDASGLITGGRFRLILDDGRSGDILIQGVRAKGHHVPRVLFSAESPLR